jgi:hypothetical protein
MNELFELNRFDTFQAIKVWQNFSTLKFVHGKLLLNQQPEILKFSLSNYYAFLCTALF